MQFKKKQPVKHKHHDLMVEYTRQKASGELAVEWWGWFAQYKGDCAIVTCLGQGEPIWSENVAYSFEMMGKHPKHPDNLIEKINFEGCPLGVKYGSWVCLGNDRWLNFSKSLYCVTIDPTVEGTGEISSDWLVYDDTKPVPRGLRVEVKCFASKYGAKGYSHVLLHESGQIYRVIGVGSGFRL